nr:hypothetical protein [Tanacetum cinerariifolium]
MTKLLKKDSVFDYNEECTKAFETLKEKLTNALIMVSPDWSQPFKLMCDASDFAVGAILLLQEFDNEIKNKKGAENVMEDHLSRLENPNLEELRDEGIWNYNPKGERFLIASRFPTPPLAYQFQKDPPPEVPMADNRTMAELLQAPTEGYEDAIVIPKIAANNFELKHEGVDCLPNEEIFAELAGMGYEKPSTKLTFYKAFFSSQWKFLIHTILQSMSAKRTSWNEFSSAMASAVICLSTEDTTAQGNDAPEPSIPSPTPPISLPQPPQDLPSTSQEALDACAALTRRVNHLEYDKVAQALEITKLKRRVKKLEKGNRVKVLKLKR